MRRLAATIATCAALAALAAAAAPAAHAALRFKSADFSIDSAPPVGAEPGAVGPPQLQAGSHPYQVEIGFAFDETTNPLGETVADGAARDLQVELPPGLIGSLAELPHCRMEEFQAGSIFSPKGCPAASQVGTLSVDTGLIQLGVPVFNLEPPPDVPAQVGAFALVAPVVMGISVRTGGDYGLTVSMRNLSQSLPVLIGTLRLWGVPADPRHDTLRGKCLGLAGNSFGSCPSDQPLQPFLTLPGSCGEPPRVTLRADSWEQPGAFVTAAPVLRDGEGNALGLRGCDGLDFSPDLEVRSESGTADAPSGFALDLRLPQSEGADARGEAEVRDAVVSLPAGVSIDPAAADGLGGCRPEEIGLDSPAEPRCPDSSRIGATTIESPLIGDPLRGSIYLATPHVNAFGSMLAVYFTAEGDGVLVKLAARIDADPVTGQLTLTLGDMPQLPFSRLALGFDGGPRAPLATPPACGTFTARASLAPHSAAGGEAVAASSGFVIDRGCGGGFSPSFSAGATTSLGGRRGDLTLRLARTDGEGDIRRFSATLPRGMLPLLGGIPPCAEAQAAAGSCAEASRIGSVAIAAGAGPHPFHFPGKVFLSGPYGGAPFGLSIVAPGIAGPFDLGPIVLRATVSVDPLDAGVTIATDALPRILQGIPLRIRSLDLTSRDRPGLFLTPTSCADQTVRATALGGAGATASLSSPFFLTGCSGLRFAPRLSASTGGRVTRAGGAALRFAIRNPLGAAANIRAISVDFPRQLSPRLSAIQSACAKATFAADPAACPPGSVVGGVTVRAPILDVPLSGPAYLVSRGADALPRIVLMPEARGILLRIGGSLRVSENGTSAATFASVPDAPISSFALRLPRGPRSALGANFLDGPAGSLCGRRLAMPVTVTAQNGLRVRRSAPVRVGGCAAAQPSGHPRR